MGGRLYISKEQESEIKAMRKENKNKNIERRLKALELYVEGKSRAEIAEKTEYSITYISKLAAKYVDFGMSAITDNHYHGNRRNMGFDEESKLLDEFKEQAEAGQIVEVSDIKAAYEKAVGHQSESHGQIYKILTRHGWRKIMPRSRHPKKASDEEIAASKKLTIR